MFVQIPRSQDDVSVIVRTDRYKFDGTNWAFEYSLDTSSFAEMNEHYGWKPTPNVLGDEYIEIQEREIDGSMFLVPVSNGTDVGTPKPVPEGNTITWNSSEDENPEWQGTEDLVADKVLVGYSIMNHEDKHLQPAGEYLTKEDFKDVMVDNFTA